MQVVGPKIGKDARIGKGKKVVNFSKRCYRSCTQELQETILPHRWGGKGKRPKCPAAFMQKAERHHHAHNRLPAKFGKATHVK